MTSLVFVLGVVPQADDGVVIAKGSIGGLPVVIAAPGEHRDPHRIAQLVQEYGVTTQHFVPRAAAASRQPPPARARPCPLPLPCRHR